MPIRHATVHHKLEKNGARLHQAMLARIQSHGEASEPSDAEQLLMEERKQLKDERTRRHDDAGHPKPKASKLVRTHHAEAKHKDAKPKAKKDKETKPAAKGAHKPTRAEKHATKAAAVEAAKKAAKKRPVAKA
jgi:hypothetical protein